MNPMFLPFLIVIIIHLQRGKETPRVSDYFSLYMFSLVFHILHYLYTNYMSLYGGESKEVPWGVNLREV